MTFEEVWEYCTAKNRLVPRPDKWNDLYSILSNKKQKSSGGWEPPLPLILGAWHFTIPLEKQLRFKEHIEWADKMNQLEDVYNFLVSLSDDDWVYFGDV